MTASIRVNGRDERLAAATVAELLRARGIVASRGVAVAVNGVVVPASEGVPRTSSQARAGPAQRPACNP